MTDTVPDEWADDGFAGNEDAIEFGPEDVAIPEIVGDEPEFDADFIQQLLGGEAPEQAPMRVTRYWLDEGSFRAIALLEQGGEVAIIVSDGENQVMLYDSLNDPGELLGVIEGLLSQAVDTLQEGSA